MAQSTRQRPPRSTDPATSPPDAEDRYRAGYSSYLETLDAQRNLFNTELAAVQLRESQLNALIRLYQVLGGGWQASREPPQPG